VAFGKQDTLRLTLLTIKFTYATIYKYLSNIIFFYKAFQCIGLDNYLTD
jgi:hypothetical protein